MVIAPAAGGHDAGQRARIALRLADVAQPLAVALFRAEVEQDVLAGERSVRRPAVLLALRAIGGEIDKEIVKLLSEEEKP